MNHNDFNALENFISKNARSEIGNLADALIQSKLKISSILRGRSFSIVLNRVTYTGKIKDLYKIINTLTPAQASNMSNQQVDKYKSVVKNLKNLDLQGEKQLENDRGRWLRILPAFFGG